MNLRKGIAKAALAASMVIGVSGVAGWRSLIRRPWSFCSCTQSRWLEAAVRRAAHRAPQLTAR
jgi:hypothetical protein